MIAIQANIQNWFIWGSIALSLLILVIVLLFQHEQRAWRRCECKSSKFYDWPEGRFCKRCLRKW